jgi:hypothetical protein
MAWCLLAVLLLHSLLEHPLWYGPFQLVAVVCIWVLWLTQPGRVAVQPGNSRVAQLSVVGLLVGAVVAATGYAVWDYHRISQIYLPPSQRASAYRVDTFRKVSPSWLFQKQVQFALLTITPLEPSNAAQLNELAKLSLHFSPEARVVQKLIESAIMLERDDEASFYLQRFQAAFPAEHQAWSEGLKSSGLGRLP